MIIQSDKYPFNIPSLEELFLSWGVPASAHHQVSCNTRTQGHKEVTKVVEEVNEVFQPVCTIRYLSEPAVIVTGSDKYLTVYAVKVVPALVLPIKYSF